MAVKMAAPGRDVSFGKKAWALGVKSYAHVARDLNEDSLAKLKWKGVSRKRKSSVKNLIQDCTIFISDIPSEASSRDLWDLFLQGRQIKDIILPRKSDKRNKRIDFVKTPSELEAGRIISNLKQLKGLLDIHYKKFENKIFEYTEAVVDEEIDDSMMVSVVAYTSNMEDSNSLLEKLKFLEDLFFKVRLFDKADMVLPRVVVVECLGLPVNARVDENLKDFFKEHPIKDHQGRDTRISNSLSLILDQGRGVVRPERSQVDPRDDDGVANSKLILDIGRAVPGNDNEGEQLEISTMVEETHFSTEQGNGLNNDILQSNDGSFEINTIDTVVPESLSLGGEEVLRPLGNKETNKSLGLNLGELQVRGKDLMQVNSSGSSIIDDTIVGKENIPSEETFGNSPNSHNSICNMMRNEYETKKR
ncbi:hypothetical protein POM88_044436 [Heracleum sosnowskyi]|uniref:RRM domain-containing protein n=1 Tax=Heracleum sosnowskyi TaxID=360622 RepID=A0AAD8H2T3_9APIA|nr:hypothetical protein POM88_044436 [Heracleum sosnowskyi]